MNQRDPMTPEDLAALADAYLAGRLTADQHAALEAELRNVPRSRALFAQFVDQAAVMHEVFSNEETVELERVEPETSEFLDVLRSLEGPADDSGIVDLTAELEQRRRRKLERDRQRERLRLTQTHEAPGPTKRVIVIPKAAVWLGLAAALGLAIWLGWPRGSAPAHNPPPPIVEQPIDGGVESPAFIAVFREGINARWASADTQPALDEPMDGRTYELVAGLARIELGRGASVVIEGPARVRMAGPNRLYLDTGRLTADVPEQAQGFTVVTPGAQVVDLGTSFGVDAMPDAQTFAQVFTGEITLASADDRGQAAAPVSLKTNEAAQADAAGIRVNPVGFDHDHFVQRETFDALAGHAGEAARQDAVYRMWERNPALIAAESFARGGQSLSYGWARPMRSTQGRVAVGADSLDTGHDAVVEGGHLALNAMDRPAVFFDPDLSPGSAADRAGLVVPGRQEFGREGTRVCIAWTVQLEEGTPTNEGWFGLSLFTRGDERDTNEMIFFGEGHNNHRWVVESHKSSPLAARRSPADVAFVGPPGGADQIEVGKEHRWLVVIDFQRGADRISIYLDPAPDALGPPQAVITDMDLRFDRLRLAGDTDACRWLFDELRLGTEIEAVLTD